MKKCLKCQKTYEDKYSFCISCGEKLPDETEVAIHNNKNRLAAIAIIVVVGVVSIGITLSEQIQMQNTKQEIEDYKHDKAMQEYLATPTIADLRINDWDTEIDGGYIYIRGSVTNTSSTKTIDYFAIEAKFYDRNGDIIDSDWTNDGDELRPNETRQFEIMHKYNWSIENVRLNVKEVY